MRRASLFCRQKYFSLTSKHFLFHVSIFFFMFLRRDACFRPLFFRRPASHRFLGHIIEILTDILSSVSFDWSFFARTDRIVPAASTKTSCPSWNTRRDGYDAFTWLEDSQILFFSSIFRDVGLRSFLVLLLLDGRWPAVSVYFQTLFWVISSCLGGWTLRICGRARRAVPSQLV